MAATRDNKIVIFGGSGPKGSIFKDVYTFDVETKEIILLNEDAGG